MIIPDRDSHIDFCRPILNTIPLLAIIVWPAVSLANVEGACADGECLLECGGNSTCRESTFGCPAAHTCTLGCSGGGSCLGASVEGPGIRVFAL